MKILVTGVGGASGICTLLALKESTDNTIVGCDCNKYAPGLYLAHENFIVPMAQESSRFVKEIIRQVNKKEIDVIFPNVDEELSIFAKNISNMPCDVIISPYSTIDVCIDKSKLMNKLENVVPLPDMKNVSPPFFIKPKVGRGSKDTFKLENENELEGLLNYFGSKKIAKSNFIIQEYLPGREYTVDALFDLDGNLIVAIPRQRLMTFGSASLVGITQKNTLLIDHVKKISKKLSFFGPVNIQFKEDDKGKPKLTEINPRCSGGMSITSKSGANLPKLSLDILTGRNISEEDIKWEEKIIFRYMTEVEEKNYDKNSFFS